MANEGAFRRIKARLSQQCLLGAELVENAQDRPKVEDVVRTFTGRPDVQVLNVRPVVDKDGKTMGYEVDIR